MAVLNMSFFSYYLGMETPMTVLLPEHRGAVPELRNQEYPVLYLLHGHADDNTAWIRKSNIEMLIRDYDCIVIMPTGHRGFYTNAVYGHAYEDYIAKEIPIIARNFFHASSKREDNYIAGLSMGGYGAMKIGMKYPETFGHIGSMSGATDLYAGSSANKMFTVSDVQKNIDNIFGGAEGFYGSKNDLTVVAKELDERNDIEVPQMYFCCGTSDPLYGSYESLKKFLQENTSLDITYDELDGAHNWDFWNREIPKMLTFFGLIPGTTTGL